MADDYLWDRSGEPDPDVERLETVLGRLRSTAPAPSLPAPFSGPALHGGASRVAVRWSWRLAAAAALAVLLLGGGAWVRWQGRARAWEVARLDGAPRVGASSLAGKGTFTVGQWLETDGVSRARIRVGTIGEVTVEPNTRLRLVSAQETDHRLALARGTVHASISAPPRLFFVETPSAVAADLGCRYTLQIDDSGEGMLSVATGWVSFEKVGRASFVPAGARCRTRLGVGPGTPYFEDAPAALLVSLARLDFEPRRPDDRLGDLEAVLAEARPKDALTLWHLLRRSSGDERSMVYARMAELAPPPAGVTREGILRGDETMLEHWWDDLGLGKSLWRKAWTRATSFLAPGDRPAIETGGGGHGSMETR